MGLIEKLQGEDANFIRLAFERYEEPAEMLEFYRAYAGWLQLRGDNKQVRENAASVAARNLSYLLMGYDDGTRGRWVAAIPFLGNPFRD